MGQREKEACLNVFAQKTNYCVTSLFKLSVQHYTKYFQ